MDALQIVNATVVTLGLPTIIAAAIFVGRRLHLLESLQITVRDDVKPDVKEIRDRLNDVRERLATLEGKTSGLFETHSPISLSQSGANYLQQSGLKKFLDDNATQLMDVCNVANLQTPYDVQESAFNFLEGYEFPDDVERALKNFAFSHGVSTDMLRRVAAIYFRDLCLKARNFKLED